MGPTDKQIEAAAEAFGIAFDHQKGLGADRLTCERWGLRAAYPHLAQWEEPTEEELYRWLGSEIYSRIITDKIIEFVRRKNAALLPVDPQPTKEATVPDIVVPEGMLKAAIEATCDTRLGMAEHTELVRQTLKAALRHLSEHPMVPTDDDVRSTSMTVGIGTGTYNMMRGFMVEWQRRMFAPPVDPRREKILAAIRTREFPMDLESEIKMTNAILAALEPK